MSDELTAWLRGVLDEDERLVPAIPQAEWEWEHAGSTRKVQIGDAEVYVDDVRWAAHIERHDPASTLADIAAKRAILDLHTIWTKPEMETVGGPIPEVSRSGSVTLTKWTPGPPSTTQPTGRTLYVCGTCDCGGDEDYYSSGLACPTVLLLASAYAHRPGYRQEWRP